MVRKFLRIVRSKGKDLRNAVIVGTGDLGIQLAQYISEIPWAGIKVIGFFDDTRKDFQKKNITTLGAIEQLKDYLINNEVDYVYITLPMKSEDKILYILNECRTLGAELLLVPNLYTFGLLNAELQALGDLVVLNFNPCARWKDIFDIVFSVLVLLATLPITLIVALLIKCEDGGPVFYRHKRITATGKGFMCLKFRTMYVDADRKLAGILHNDPLAREEWEKTFKLKNDPRVTRIGKFLRKTSLDELPQFINVLKGEMSVVGARPIVHDELCNYYGKNAGLYCSMKPGITGPWQVYRRSDTEDYDERVQLDSWYVLNYSFWTDLKIIFKTVLCMINGKGAY
jgi:exopolysaccharide biosynthesis polyprenyl glycosylphosphotransferase